VVLSILAYARRFSGQEKGGSARYILNMSNNRFKANSWLHACVRARRFSGQEKVATLAISSIMNSSEQSDTCVRARKEVLRAGKSGNSSYILNIRFKAIVDYMKIYMYATLAWARGFSGKKAVVLASKRQN
jgi:hypothetical protein